MGEKRGSYIVRIHSSDAQILELLVDDHSRCLALVDLVAHGRMMHLMMHGAVEDHTTWLDLGREPSLDYDRLGLVRNRGRLLDDDLARWWRHFGR